MTEAMTDTIGVVAIMAGDDVVMGPVRNAIAVSTTSDSATRMVAYVSGLVNKPPPLPFQRRPLAKIAKAALMNRQRCQKSRPGVDRQTSSDEKEHAAKCRKHNERDDPASC